MVPELDTAGKTTGKESGRQFMEEILAEKYELKESIGNGGSGTVYLVWDRNLGKHMALKEMEICGIWEREKEVLKELRHPALPVITDCFEENGKKYLVMDYIEGMTLLQYLERFGRVGEKKAVIWAKELAEVLCYLHEQCTPVIYRDMKPSNVMIDKEGRLKLIDFGTVYLRHSDSRKQYMRAGTSGYAAPEQMAEDAFLKTDERSDVYGLGATLHHMLTGKNPTRPPFMRAPIRSYDRTLSPALEKLVGKAVMQDKDKRYKSMRHMKEELEFLEEREKRNRVFDRVLAAIYCLLLGLMGAGYIFAYYKAEYYGGYLWKRTVWENRMLAFALGVFFLCLGRWLSGKIWGTLKGRRQRIFKSVYLSEKKNAGLPFLFFGVMLAVSLSAWQVSAAEGERPLPVTVYAEDGRRLLIRYDAVYRVESGMRLFLPADSFIEEKEYILKLECSDRETGETRRRIFYLKGGSVQDGQP